MYANTDLSRPILCLMSEPRVSKIAGTAETFYKELVGSPKRATGMTLDIVC